MTDRATSFAVLRCSYTPQLSQLLRALSTATNACSLPLQPPSAAFLGTASTAEDALPPVSYVAFPDPGAPPSSSTASPLCSHFWVLSDAGGLCGADAGPPCTPPAGAAHVAVCAMDAPAVARAWLCSAPDRVTAAVGAAARALRGVVPGCGAPHARVLLVGGAGVLSPAGDDEGGGGGAALRALVGGCWEEVAEAARGAKGGSGAPPAWGGLRALTEAQCATLGAFLRACARALSAAPAVIPSAPLAPAAAPAVAALQRLLAGGGGAPAESDAALGAGGAGAGDGAWLAALEVAAGAGGGESLLAALAGAPPPPSFAAAGARLGEGVRLALLARAAPGAWAADAAVASGALRERAPPLHEWAAALLPEGGEGGGGGDVAAAVPPPPAAVLRVPVAGRRSLGGVGPRRASAGSAGSSRPPSRPASPEPPSTAATPAPAPAPAPPAAADPKAFFTSLAAKAPGKPPKKK
jgi:hypothetical protein